MSAIDLAITYLRARLHAREVIAESPPEALDRFHHAGLPFLAVYVIDAMQDALRSDERDTLADQIRAECRDGAWAWSPAAGVDVDTTSAAMRALARLGRPHPLQALARFYNPGTGLYLTFHDAGFVNASLGLQLPPQRLDRHRGSHPCVLGQVYLLLQEAGALHELRPDLLEAIQQADGSWASYCYPSRYYATRFFAELLGARWREHPTTLHHITRTLDFLLGAPAERTPTREAERGLALLALVDAQPSRADAVARALQEITAYLRAVQLPDGSWSGDRLWEFLDEDGSWVASVDARRIRSTALAASLLRRVARAYPSN